MLSPMAAHFLPDQGLLPGKLTPPVVLSATSASFHDEPSALTLMWKLSSPVSPASARPENPVWNSWLAVSPAAFLLSLS